MPARYAASSGKFAVQGHQILTEIPAKVRGRRCRHRADEADVRYPEARDVDSCYHEAQTKALAYSEQIFGFAKP